MTTTDIDAIRQREQAATPGPWRAHTTYPHTVWQGSEDREDPGIISTTLADEVVADAVFIAHARTDVPALLAKVDELTAELAEERAEHQATGMLQRAANERADRLSAELANAWNALTQSRAQAATYANEIGALKAELERQRAEVAK